MAICLMLAMSTLPLPHKSALSLGKSKEDKECHKPYSTQQAYW